MKKLEWYALKYDFNTSKLININVLNEDVLEEIKKMIKRKKITNYKEFKNVVISEMKWRYWCKSEHEMLVSDLWDKGKEKIDVYRQLEPNIDRLCEYIMKELKIKVE